MSGEREWATGSPRTTSRRVLALTLTLRLGREPVRDRRDQTFQFRDGIPVDIEVPTEGIADFRFLPGTSGVFPQHVHAAFAAQLVYPGAVMAGHRDDEVGIFDQLARQQAGAVSGEVEPL